MRHLWTLIALSGDDTPKSPLRQASFPPRHPPALHGPSAAADPALSDLGTTDTIKRSHIGAWPCTRLARNVPCVLRGDSFSPGLFRGSGEGGTMGKTSRPARALGV